MKMNNLMLNEQITTSQLKQTHSALSKIITLDFGVKQNKNFIVPKSVSFNTVELMQIQKLKKRR